MIITKLKKRKLQKLDNNLIYWMRFNEGAGSVARNQAGSQNNGSITEAAFSSDSAGGGFSLDFDGIDDFVAISNVSNQLLSSFTDGFSISAWIKPESQGEGLDAGAGRIVDKSGSTLAADGYVFALASSGRFAAKLRAAGDLVYSANDAWTADTWVHCVVTIDSDSLVSFYINGVASGTPASSGAIDGNDTTEDLTIGNRAGATDRTFDGIIDEVKIYNKVLSQYEITLLSKAR